MRYRSTFVAASLSTVVLAQAPSWLQLVPTASPIGRYNFGMAHDLGRSRTVLFSGSPLLLADTWEFDGVTWTQVMPPAVPPARCCHTLAYVPAVGRIVLFGGSTTSADVDSLGDTWQWDGATWTHLAPPVSPSARMAQAMATDWRAGTVLLFGGRDTSSVPQQDTWSWNGATWSLLASGGPPPRCCHSMAQDLSTGNMVMFGGWDLGDRGDTWEFDGVAWHQAAPIGGSPSPRWGHRMAFDLSNERLLLQGGYGSGGDETWQWNGKSWFLVALTAGRDDYNHEFVYDAVLQRPLLFGGVTAPTSTAAFVTAAPATAAPFGAPCAGPAGTPALQPRAGNLPWIGQAVDLELDPVGGLALIAFGLSRTSSGGVSLPASLAPHGAPGCTVFVSTNAVRAVVAAPTVQVAMQLPSVPAFVGLHVYVQGFVLDAGANALGLTTSNALDLQIGW